MYAFDNSELSRARVCIPLPLLSPLAGEIYYMDKANWQHQNWNLFMPLYLEIT